MNPAKLPQVMVATARQRGLNDVLRTMIDGIAQCANVILARIWLIAPSNLCEVCNVRDKSADSTRLLHLVASAWSFYICTWWKPGESLPSSDGFTGISRVDTAYPQGK